ncbi:MAG: trypsin-like peptidase domain-containing protein [Kiritimatiellia bacterium]|nr:trypsin-like peptidase domain-containing protein [Kiritimatiellia bacterium]
MKHICLILSVLIFSVSQISRGDQNFKDSVVKIYVTIQREDYKTPWQPVAPNSGSGSGLIIQKKRILTNAHVISDARFIEIQREGDPRKYQATVLFAGHDCDLAVLTVPDESFFEGTRPLSLGPTLPSLNDEVIVLGYPMGGERIALTKGVVSRIDYIPYSHSEVDQHLAMQVDAAINPGNSGGPVLFRDRVVGVAFQGMFLSQSIGYAIPLPVIQHFLADIEDGAYDGYPELGVLTIETRNPALRRSLNLDGKSGGTAVSRVDHFGSAAGLLRAGDVLLAVDGHALTDDGTFIVDGQTMQYTELIERKQCGESVKFEVWRNGESKPITVPLLKYRNPFAFRREYDRRPEYFIYGGLVFAPLSLNLLAQIGKELNQPESQQLLYYSRFVETDGLYSNQNQFVVLSERLAQRVNTYDDQFLYKTVSEINGQPIRQMSDLPRAFSMPSNNLHVIRFKETSVSLTMEAEEAQKAESEIRRRYNVSAPSFLREATAP